MATVVNSIGSFVFISMSPTPPTNKIRTKIETRQGVDGFSVWKEATRGQIWQCRTAVDVANFTVGQALVQLYEDAVGGAPVALVYANLGYGNVIIKDVNAMVQTQLLGIGGTAGTSGALVRATWQLLIP